MAFTDLKIKNPFWLATNLPSYLSDTTKFEKLLNKCNSAENLKQYLLKITEDIPEEFFTGEQLYNIITLVAFAAYFTHKDENLTMSKVVKTIEIVDRKTFMEDSSDSDSSMDTDSL